MLDYYYEMIEINYRRKERLTVCKETLKQEHARFELEVNKLKDQIDENESVDKELK